MTGLYSLVHSKSSWSTWNQMLIYFTPSASNLDPDLLFSVVKRVWRILKETSLRLPTWTNASIFWLQLFSHFCDLPIFVAPAIPSLWSPCRKLAARLSFLHPLLCCETVIGFTFFWQSESCLPQYCQKFYNFHLQGLGSWVWKRALTKNCRTLFRGQCLRRQNRSPLFKC
jgi:hypothetical protein